MKFIEPEATMDIYTKAGSKIIFTGENGHDWEQEEARKILTIGSEYTLASSIVYPFSTSVTIEEFPDAIFNSVLFKNKQESEG